jgi:hypothetical protein
MLLSFTAASPFIILTNAGVIIKNKAAIAITVNN